MTSLRAALVAVVIAAVGPFSGCGGGGAGASGTGTLVGADGQPGGGESDVELAATAETVDQTRIPPGKGWWCFEARVGQRPAVVGCDRTKDQCESVRFEYKSDPGAQAATTTSCQASARALCYTLYDATTRRYESSCHGDEFSCGRNRSQARLEPRYRMLSPCEEVP